MLYLDDFIEAIENFPEELRDMLTTIRELDLGVQNAMDEQSKRSDVFFQNARKMKTEKRITVFTSIMLDFKKILEDAGEKVNVAERLRHLLLRRLEQLDREIGKFKVDLEADSPGITAVIEKRALMDSAVESEARTCKEKRIKSKKKDKKRAARLSGAPITDLGFTQEQQLPLDFASLQVDNGILLSSNVPIDADVNFVYDPTRYCICNQVSYGNMIACDNDLCSYEWFHYACVNLTIAPEGKWYCPKCKVCTVSLKRNQK
ncbi:inhibitor of growth protein 3-like [Phymastichus coffea]|uniref:inhibitor of growth protein 3-like n=1 Tax=Phymastichus coffea TaxID=108790 RepID=UPI00273C1FD7|nr:inhibitor of growth protein 3-like [Phymastichus coffea]